MKGMGRNLLFWGKTLEKMVLMTTLWVVAIVGFMTLLEGGDFRKEFGNELPVYLIMLTFISVFIIGMNGAQLYFPLTVSFGSTRRQSFAAMQVILHLIVAEYLAVIFVFSYFCNRVIWQFCSGYFLPVLGALFVICGLGNLIAATYMRFGRIIGVIIYIVLMLLIIGAGSIGLFMTDKNGGADFMTQGGWNGLLQGPFILLAGILFDAIVIALFYVVVRKQNLKFVG